jgi:tetratricopeptide (TPR) repeat protein
MSRKSLLVEFVIVVLSLGIYGCGSSTNLNQLWLGSEDGVDTLIVECRVAYDQGDFDLAEEKCEKAVEINPDNEDANILMGYVNLSRGGIDPFRLARELISISDSGKDDGASLQGDDDDDGEATDSASDASSTLQSLGNLINLSDADIASLSSKLEQCAEGVASTDEAPCLTTDLFLETPVFQPKTITGEVRASVEVLDYMSKAIEKVCGYVSPSVKVEGDTRHTCERSELATNNAKGHFLWAFAHLTEALVFQTVLLYSSAEPDPETGKQTSNFQAGANNLNEFDGGLTDFAARIDDMKTATDTVFNIAGEGSMIDTTLSALDAVNKAFGVLSGLPEKITSRITGAMSKIRETGEKLGGGESGDSKALKGQMTDKTGKVVKKKIDEAVAASLEKAGVQGGVGSLSNLPPEQKQQFTNDLGPVCTSYGNIVEGGDPAKKEDPEACSALGLSTDPS